MNNNSQYDIKKTTRADMRANVALNTAIMNHDLY